MDSSLYRYFTPGNQRSWMSPPGLPLQREIEPLAAPAPSLSIATIQRTIAPSFELSVSDEIRRALVASAVQQYGKYDEWSASDWERRTPAIISRLHAAEKDTFRPLRDQELDAPGLRPAWPLPAMLARLETALQGVAVLTEHAQKLGHSVEPLCRELSRYWWYQKLHDISPEMAGIHRWFTVTCSEYPPQPAPHSVAAGACIDALCTLLNNSFANMGVSSQDRKHQKVIAIRISTVSEGCINAASGSDLLRVNLVSGELLGEVYQNDSRFRGTLAGKVADDNLPVLEQQLWRRDTTSRRGKNGEFVAHVERARNRVALLDSLVAAFVSSEQRLRPSGPHQAAIDYLEQVNATAKGVGPNIPTVLTQAIAALTQNQLR